MSNFLNLSNPIPNKYKTLIKYRTDDFFNVNSISFKQNIEKKYIYKTINYINNYQINNIYRVLQQI